MNRRLVAATALDARARMALAVLAREALSSYYKHCGLAQALLLSALADEMQDPTTELGAGRALFVGDVVAAVLVAYPAAEIRTRQQASLFHLLRAEAGGGETILAAAEEQASKVPPILPDSHYLARIAVSPAFQRQGLARSLLEALDETAPGSNPVSLHVHRDNERALHLYRRAGFLRSDDLDLPFQSYVRYR